MSLAERVRANHREQIAAGQSFVTEVRPGLVVHGYDGFDALGPDQPFVRPAGIAMALILKGGSTSVQRGQEFRVGDRAEAVMTSLQGPEAGYRRCSGGHVRYIGISMAHPWLSDDEPEPFSIWDRGHFDVHRWELTPQCRQLSEHLFDLRAKDDPISRLRFESMTLDLVADVMARFTEPQTGLSPKAMARVRQARDLIDADPASFTTIRQLCLDVGVNPTTLQQQFREAYGLTIFDYVRNARLTLGIAALKRGEPVSRSAFLAGFSSPANFATAVKRRTGVSPKALRF